VKHSKYAEDSNDYEFRKVSEQDKEVLERIAELQEKQPFHYIRNSEQTYDILMTWQPIIYAIFEQELFAGYLVLYENNTVKEILLEQPRKVREAVAAFVTKVKKEGVTFELPEFQRDYIDALMELSENVSIQVGENFSVFHYDKVIEAFLKLKSLTDPLVDGEVTLLIHGKRSDERIHIKVEGGQISVTPTEQAADYELSHSQAMELLFHNYSPLRNQTAPQLQNWFPLSIYIYPADLV
jgi:hypothetical protein